jgi:asparagine synthase (glutamine-hydrolysing)
MCGILGLVTERELSGVQLRSRVRAMGRWQFHRGPDGWGEWFGAGVALGHNRLAILDLAGGQQPMSSHDGRIQVVFNGEIYNFRGLWRELESKGYAFRTDHADTEVIVHGFAEWGPAVFDRLEGMFAVAVWDDASDSLFLARDPLGIKPLFFAETPNGLVFASEPKTILASGWLEPGLAVESVLDYFMFRAPLAPRTLFEGIHKLEPGSWLRYRRANKTLVEERYWAPQATAGAGEPRQVEQHLERVLDDAVSSHLIADVPIGVFLSGGVDSSLLAALVARRAELNAFTVGTFSRLDESKFASRVASHVGLPLHVRFVSGDDFRDRFDDWCFFNDDPVADPSALALMLLTEHAREHGMKVMLAGEGADEIFGGYYSYLRYGTYAALRQVPLAIGGAGILGRRMAGVDADYLRSLGNLRFFGSAHVLVARDRAGLFSTPLLNAIHEWEDASFRPRARGISAPRSAMLFDQETRLPNDLLPRTDRATMAYSIEARVPYLDRRVVELANSLPPGFDARLLPPRGKVLLKRLAARQVPKDVIYRRKRGFNLPVSAWLQKDFRERIEGFLHERAFDFLDYRYLRTLYERAPDSHAALLWAWLVLEQWQRLWLAGEARPARPAVIANEDAYRLLASADCGASAAATAP